MGPRVKPEGDDRRVVRERLCEAKKAGIVPGLLDLRLWGYPHPTRACRATLPTRGKEKI
jgi:hypothetical protein